MFENSPVQQKQVQLQTTTINKPNPQKSFKLSFHIEFTI